MRCVSRSINGLENLIAHFATGVAGRARLSKAGEVNFNTTLRIAGLNPFAPGFELRPYRPPRRTGQQAFCGLVAGGGRPRPPRSGHLGLPDGPSRVARRKPRRNSLSKALFTNARPTGYAFRNKSTESSPKC
jgi:hypothetical protein